MRKRILATALLLVLLLSLCGCGKGNDPRVGRYEGDRINLLGWKPVSEVYENGENYLEIKAGGKGTLCLDGSRMPMKWKDNSDGNIVVTVENQDMEAVFEGITVTLDFLGFEITFVRNTTENTSK